MKSLTNLAHEEDGVEDDEQHDEVLKGRRCDKSPDVVARPHLRLRHVDLLRSYRHDVRYARFLRIKLLLAVGLFFSRR